MKLFIREVVGWSIDSRTTKPLVIDAFTLAVNKENPNKGLIFHSDRGVQYASYDYQDLLRESGFLQSMMLKDSVMIMLVLNHSSHHLRKISYMIVDLVLNLRQEG